MYHPINRLNCPALEKLNQLARLTIAFGLEQFLQLPEDEIRTRFIAHFQPHQFPNAGTWLWGKPTTIKQPLLKLLIIPLDKKQGILDAFDADSDIEARFAEGHFRAPNIPIASRTQPDPADPNSEPALELVNAILRNFYTNILADAGAPADVLAELDNLERQTVLQAYLEAQRPLRLKVCPGCDGPPPSVADGKIHEDLDHIFPKKKYPFLSVHPLNLTPFCKHCNQTYKHEKDAILDNEAIVANVTSLADIYHPYLRPARGEIQVVVERDAQDAQPHLHLRPNHNDPQQVAKLNSLNYVLNLEARWDGDLQEERVQEPLKGYLHYSNLWC